MKIAFTSIGLFAAIFILSGCMHTPEQEREQEQQQTQMQAEGQEQMQNQEQSGDSNMAQIMKDIAAGKKMECTYSMEGGDGQMVQAKMYVDGERYRTESSFNGMEYVAVFDGEKVYSWQRGTNEGFVIEPGCFEGMGSDDVVQNQEQTQQEYYESSEEAINSFSNVKCESASNVDVSVPSDVNFVDQCQMMQQQFQKMEQFQNQMPEDVQGMMQ